MTGSSRVDPAFAAMTLDLLGSLLSRADNPAGVSTLLAEELRELTGARCVLVTDEADLAPEAPPRVVAVTPARRIEWTASPAVVRALRLTRAVGAAQVLDDAEGSPLREALRAEGFDRSFVVPLTVGAHRVGVVLVLGHPDAAHARSALALLETLATVVALVARNAFLYERQEQTIAARTRELSQAAEALRQSRDRLRFALTATQSVWDWDLVNGVLSDEREWAAQRGDRVREIRGDVREVLSAIVHPDDLALVLERFEAHVRGETPIYELEHRVPGSDGRERWLLMRGRATSRDAAGRAQRLIGVTTDVTERRVAQAQLVRAERLAGLGTLAAGVAHEINNPLSYIIANLSHVAEWLGERGVGEASVSAALADALDGAQRVREVVNALRTFSQPRSGEPEAVDVEEEIRAAVRLTENEIRHRARLEVEVGPLPRVVAGAHQLGQVFVNLLVNAAQAIPPSAAKAARVKLSARTDPEGRVEVSVQDTGVGIPPAALPRIFEPFFTTKTQGVGTGLGLSISHGIVVAAGGTIAVESKLGAGTTFRVTLPPATAGAARGGTARSATGGPAPRGAPGPAGPRRRVLIVDDEPAVGRAAQRLLARWFDVELRQSGAEAIADIERGDDFDAVVCDLMMPDVSGMELFRRVQGLRPALAGRFIFLTGGAFTEESRRFVETVGRPFVEKPFDGALLHRVVDEVADAAGGGPELPAGAWP